MSSKKTSTYHLIVCTLLLMVSFTVSAKNNQLQTSVLHSIEKNILLPDSKHAVAVATKLSSLLNQLEQQNNQQNLTRVQAQFTNLIKAWKKVEALYNAGNINSDMLDTPRYIDTFHTGKEDLSKQLHRALNSSKEVKRALFKNSTKSIGALEYMLFYSDNGNVFEITAKDASRRIKMAQHINARLTEHLEEIHQFYLNDFSNNKIFVEKGNKSVEDLVNVLIDSSYKLLTWRVAEAGGFSDKYNGEPSAQHLEYHLSKSSFYAIESILQSFKNVLNSQKYLDLGDLGTAQGVAEKISSVQRNIDTAIEKNQLIMQTMSKNDLKLSEILLTQEYKNLHRSLVRLHNSFYILLIDSLGLKAKIIEADGD